MTTTKLAAHLNQNLNDESKSIECFAESNSILTNISEEAKIAFKTKLYIGSFGMTDLVT